MTKENNVQMAHLFDATRCIGCTACIAACLETNHPELLERDIPGRDWLGSNIRRITLERARRPQMLLVQCQHCSDAPCISTCPFGANWRDPETGLVKTDESLCMGCSYCVASCPYDVRWTHPDTGVPMKCMGPGCEALVKAGKSPACVSACPVSARAFGDIHDPDSTISKRVAVSKTEKLLPHKGTQPNFFVVVTK